MPTQTNCYRGTYRCKQSVTTADIISNKLLPRPLLCHKQTTPKSSIFPARINCVFWRCNWEDFLMTGVFCVGSTDSSLFMLANEVESTCLQEWAAVKSRLYFVMRTLRSQHYSCVRFYIITCTVQYSTVASTSKVVKTQASDQIS